MFTTPHTVHPVAVDSFGLARIGQPRLDMMGVRFHSPDPAATPSGQPNPAQPTPPTVQPTAPQFNVPPSTTPGVVPPAPSGTPAPPAPTPPAATPPAAQPQPGINPKTGQPYTPEETAAYVSSVRDEAKASREAKEAAEKRATEAEARSAAILKAAGFNPDGTPYTDVSPDDLTSRLTDQTSQTEAAQRENLVLRVAPGLGADADRLLDSRAFATKLAGLKVDDREGITALVKTTLENDASFRNTPPAAASSGSTTHTGTTPTNARKTMHEAVQAKIAAPPASTPRA